MINAEYIPKEDLIDGASYYCIARNFKIGIWNGKSFNYTRDKFGTKFVDVEYHWDDGAPNGTVKPLARMLEE
jgi:hypothetical protein